MERLRFHSERCIFCIFELLKLDSRWDFRRSLSSAAVPGNAKLVIVGVGRVHFLVGLQRASLEKWALEALDAAGAKVGEGKKASKDKHDTTLPKIYLPI